MKLVAYIALLLLAVTGRASVNAQPAAPREYTRADTVFPYCQLMPVNQSGQDASFAKFMSEFRTSIYKKDIAYIVRCSSKDIKWSFGDKPGIKGFIKSWGLDTAPKNHRFWQQLEDAISLGGVFDEGGRSRIAYPYLYQTFPAGYSAFDYAAVTARNIPVRSAPDSKAEAPDTVGCEIVQLADPGDADPVTETIDGRTYPWVKIRRHNGRIGFVYGRFIRSPVGYRAIFIKTRGRWKLDCFIQGD